VPASIAVLKQQIDNEIIRAMGLPLDGWLADRLHAILGCATRHFSELFTEVDRIVGEQGLPAGAAWLLRQLAPGLDTRGTENIPAQGPLIIASNHPGAVDSVAVTASAGRPDLKIIASAVPFLQSLPSISGHLIFAPKPEHVEARMLALRGAVRHLESGGALLLFAHGNIDPDPAFMPDADRELTGWSRSLEICLRSVPETQVIISIVSGVIDPACMRHPLTWLRHARPDRQRLAMMIQIIQQMLGRKLEIRPRVSFGELLDLAHIGSAEHALPTITERARLLMRSHLAWQP
jgi:hypothetical protein